MSIDQYFELIGFCLNSLKIINYNKVTTVRYSFYNLLNSRYLKLTERVRALPLSDTEIIEIKDFSINPRSAPPPSYIKTEQTIKSARRRSLATYISSLSDLKLGYIKKKR
jgi:hypothetical protein